MSCGLARSLVALAFACALASSAGAQAAFYHGKQVRLIVGYAVGNDYDLAARLLARFLSKHIPGEPGIIVQNYQVLGTRMRIVVGYKGATDAVLAMERGEVQGACALDLSYRTPEQLETALAALYRTPPDLIETVKKLVPHMQ
ncbi:MAG: hypothetical protein IT537_02925 [Hyphomicrobiales bacterium]|nr:hypothetical protein [Hyphomicrobiales bacterium]